MGSSPLTRGKRGAALRVSRHGGLIPAHAGKTRGLLLSVRARGAHPRSRGENAIVGFPVELIRGSSPLTRGKHLGELLGGFDVGLIPAHAGKTRGTERRHRGPGAHPRSRGENSSAPSSTPSCEGSSPLTRGKPERRRRVLRPPGLIPAHAGKTWFFLPYSPRVKAHPRSRGENKRVASRYSTPRGSSPLTRGKLLADSVRKKIKGLIPAHAGKTVEATYESVTERAHPRSRGENASACARGGGFAGSSPLTRGKRLLSGSRISEHGLIPAHAGKTGLVSKMLRLRAAHPRSRGENTTWSVPIRPNVGSSPLTRGKLLGDLA